MSNHYRKALLKLHHYCHRFQRFRTISLSSHLKNDSGNNQNKNDGKSIDTVDEHKSGPEQVKEFSEDDELKWGPNEGVPYDPSTDKYFHQKLIGYKYPQFFTRKIKQITPQRMVKIIKDDLSVLKEGRIKKRPDELPIPNHVDVAIFGGGIIGSSIAYAMKERAPNSFSCAVIERDPTVIHSIYQLCDLPGIYWYLFLFSIDKSLVYKSFDYFVGRRNSSTVFSQRKHSDVHVFNGFLEEC